jgi:Heparinase II/III-like protein/Heparinase II/III N-terminus
VRLGWRLQRLRAMELGEIVWRARNVVVQRLWRVHARREWHTPPARPRWAGGHVPFTGSGAATAAAQDLLERAEALLESGRWEVFGQVADLSGPDPDWFLDPLTGIRAPSEELWFRVPYRDERRVGNVKVIWEVSRLHHLTVLAAAYCISLDSRYAVRALEHLRSWQDANPPLHGIHWVSGIEMGLRLIAWCWMRRLLQHYPGIAQEFEFNPRFQRQLHAHQHWIATFYSRGSSANNHVIAEMAGLLAASRAFPIFAASRTWATLAASHLERDIVRQTFPDGLNRELASEYHGFTCELFMSAAVAANASGTPLSDHYWAQMAKMLDALAATVDCCVNPARQGDGDEGRALVVDGRGCRQTDMLLEAGALLLGRPDWWPTLRTGSIGASLLAATSPGALRAAPRAPSRSNLFVDAGIAILRDLEPGADELWCRFDYGPHGFLALAAHAHADALSFELRCGGQEVLVDPGTYCYHGEPDWRRYFRSTLAHNTLDLEEEDQATQAGAFLWSSKPRTRLIFTAGLTEGLTATAEASHDGYDAKHQAVHRRRVVLNRQLRSLQVHDVIEAARPVRARLMFHMHPRIACCLVGDSATLTWNSLFGERQAVMTLPSTLQWALYQGQTAPILGWYSKGFGQKQPAPVLVGTGRIGLETGLLTEIAFGSVHNRTNSASISQEECI